MLSGKPLLSSELSLPRKTTTSKEDLMKACHSPCIYGHCIFGTFSCLDAKPIFLSLSLLNLLSTRLLKCKQSGHLSGIPWP
jgi:hypothetical protein